MQIVRGKEWVLRSIGNTPIVRLSRQLVGEDFNIFAKCEFVNPSGSHKDRIYLHGINELEKEGIIRPGMTLVDFSSGNAGAALALVGSLKGYKVIIVRPEGLSKVKALQIRHYGGEIVKTPGENGVPGARNRAKELTAELGESGFLMYQTDRDFNTRAFYNCGEEIVDFFRKHRLSLDAFVCGIGTGGTFSGIAKVVKESFPNALCVAVEIDRAAVLYAERHGQKLEPSGHGIEGLSTGELYPNTDRSLVDEVEICTEEQAWEAARMISELEGLLVGPSSGVEFLVSKKVAAKLGPGSNVVTVFFDQAWKYFKS